jgi:hypothetical protein
MNLKFTNLIRLLDNYQMINWKSVQPKEGL